MYPSPCRPGAERADRREAKRGEDTAGCRTFTPPREIHSKFLEVYNLRRFEITRPSREYSRGPQDSPRTRHSRHLRSVRCAPARRAVEAERWQGLPSGLSWKLGKARDRSVKCWRRQTQAAGSTCLRCFVEQGGFYDHIVAFWAAERVQHGAQTGVSRPVVVDGDSFLDARFSSARQDRGTRHHRLQVGGRRHRPVAWRHPA